MAILDFFVFLLQNVLYAIDYMLLIMRTFGFWVHSVRQPVLISPQIKNSVFSLYESFKVSSRVLINRLKSPVADLYKYNMINLVNITKYQKGAYCLGV